MKITSKIMTFWYIARAIFGGAAVVLLFMLIRKLTDNSNKEEKSSATKALSFKPSDKDLKESLEIVSILDEIYKV